MQDHHCGPCPYLGEGNYTSSTFCPPSLIEGTGTKPGGVDLAMAFLMTGSQPVLLLQLQTRIPFSPPLHPFVRHRASIMSLIRRQSSSGPGLTPKELYNLLWRAHPGTSPGYTQIRLGAVCSWDKWTSGDQGSLFSWNALQMVSRPRWGS